jgi:hypothetical protein
MPKYTKTQKSTQEYYRGIIGEIGLCESIKTSHPDKYRVLSFLISKHPKRKAEGHVDLSIRLAYGGTNTLFFILPDGSSDSISWNKCITGKNETHAETLIEVMRNEIYFQTHDFKVACLSSGDVTCGMCGVICTDEGGTKSNTIHVDHHIVPFCDLVLVFLKQNSGSIPSVFDKRLNQYKCFRRLDGQFKMQWLEFHKMHAQFQILCCTCNCRQGNKTSVHKNVLKQVSNLIKSVSL